MRLRVVRIAIAAVAAEVLGLLSLILIVIFFGPAEEEAVQAFAERLGYWVGPISGFVFCLLGGWWVARGLADAHVQNGLVLGLVAAGLDLGIYMAIGGGFEPVIVASNVGRVVAGTAGGWLASRFSQSVPLREPSEGDALELRYNHPKLGELYWEEGTWCNEQATVSMSSVPICVFLDGGGSEAPSDTALAGYDWIQSHWSEVLQLIQEQASDFYEPYADAMTGVPRFEDPTQIWGTEVLLTLRVKSKETFTVSMRFTWQETSDPHDVTFYVSDSRCVSHSVDG